MKNRMNIKPVFSAFLLVVCLIFTPGLSAQEKLEEYLQIAGENNPQIQAAFKEYMAAMEQVPQVGALPDPTVALGIFLQPVETRVGAQQFTSSLSQKFPWFGTLGAKKDAASQLAKAKYEDFVEAKLKLYREVGITYNELYFLQKSIGITKENLELLGSFKELARVNFEGGRTGFVSVLRVETDEQEMKDRLLQLQDKKLPLKAKFEQFLNKSMEQDIVFPDSLWKEPMLYTKETVLDSVRENSPQLRKLEFQKNALEEQEKVAAKEGLPSFSVGVNYINIAPRTDMEVADNGKDALVFPQVGVSIPLYRGKYKAMRREASLKKEAVSLRKEDATNQLVTQVEMLFREYKDALRRIELNARLADISQHSLDLLQTEFSNSQTDFEELLRMERKVLNYKLEEERARVELNNAVYNINYLMGK